MSIERVGIIGGGQLAWMMGHAAKKLTIDLIVQTPNPSDPAVSTASNTVFAPVADTNATAELATLCDVITFENEFINLDALSNLSQQGVCFRPKLESLKPLLDKYSQRRFLYDLGLPVPKFVAFDVNMGAGEDLICRHLGLPLVIKARRHGYDGHGTHIVENLKDLKAKLLQYKQTRSNTSLLLEEFISFEFELGIIATRSASGEVFTHPVVETQQEQQVCRRVIAPADITSAIAEEIENIASTILNNLEVVGTFGIEFFLSPETGVLVNEIAPRTHNSGHFSIDACQTSQFEQQLRAVCELPLGSTEMICPGAVMVNLLGYDDFGSDWMQKRQQIEEIPQAHLHWYGKTESRPGRKLGHVTVLLNTQSRERALEMARQVESIWYG